MLEKSVYVSSIALLFILVLAALGFNNSYAAIDNEFLNTFDLEGCGLSPNGSNSYFVLEPGYQLVLEGQEDGATIQLIVTVLNETKTVDGVQTRVVEEKESEDGELIEISRNYFAICKDTNDIFYFGEDVDVYDNNQVVSHEGAWLAGKDGAKAGLMVPAKPEVGFKYYQEVAPGVAEDKAEIISLNEVLSTPAGNFENVLKIEETNALDHETEYKYHAPGVGLIQDEVLKLVKYVLPEVEEPQKWEMKSSVQTVVVSGNQIDVAINSTSTISEFTLEQESKRISFIVNETNGSVGRTEISIGRILEGPYMVMIDGQASTDFNLTETSTPGDEKITVSYPDSASLITIAGTNVVPEFPIPVAGLAGALLGVIILVGKARRT